MLGKPKQVTIVKGWSKRSMQGRKADLKKTCSKDVAREFIVNSPEACDSNKECKRIFDKGKRWKIT